MKKIILKPNICIDEIENVITKKQQWEIIEKKYNFYKPYVSTFDGLNYEAKVDLYISFKTKGNYIHKMYFYFLDFENDYIFKISDIKSNDHPNGQMTTRIADFKYYKTTGNLGFKIYHSPVFGQEYNLSHNYHNFFNALDKNDAPNKLSYVCILLKYYNHAQSKKQIRYYVNSYKKFITSWILKVERFEIRKTRILTKQNQIAIMKKQKQEAKLAKNQIAKVKNISINKKPKISNSKISLQNHKSEGILK